MHKYFIGDIVLQTLFYMALSFSTVMISDKSTYNHKDVAIFSVLDTIIRIIVLIIDISSIFYNGNKNIFIYITAILFLINIMVEIILYKKVKKVKEVKEVKEVKQEELNKFIEKYRQNELDYNKLNDESKEIMNDLEIQGKSNILFYFVQKYF